MLTDLIGQPGSWVSGLFNFLNCPPRLGGWFLTSQQQFPITVAYGKAKRFFVLGSLALIDRFSLLILVEMTVIRRSCCGEKKVTDPSHTVKRQISNCKKQCSNNVNNDNIVEKIFLTKEYYRRIIY